jgi:hypothetical protein
MNTRRKFIIIVLFAVTMDWALWLGGQFFNALMVIPGWAFDPPATIRLYQHNMLTHIHAYFFMVANPVFLLPLLIIAWFLSRRLEKAFSRWLGIAVLLDLFITLMVGIWMAPTARSIFDAATHGATSTNVAGIALHTWRIANGCRIALGMVTLLFLLISISKLHLLRYGPSVRQANRLQPETIEPDKASA